MNKLIAAFIFSFFIGCSNMNKTYTLSFNPPIGSAYKYILTNTKTITQIIFGEEKKSVLSERISFMFYVKKFSANSYHVAVQFDSLSMTSENKYDQDSAIDFENNNSFDKMLTAFNGAKFDLYIASNGEITEFVGYNQFKEKIDVIYKSFQNPEQLTIAPSLVFDQNFFIHLFKDQLKVLPSLPVSLHSSWQSLDTIVAVEPINMSVTYTLDSVSKGIAYIGLEAPINNDRKFAGQILYMSGKQQGQIEIEENTGMLLKKRNFIEIKGHLKNDKIDIAQIININTKIEGIKLQ